jgi:hypothetical protein
MSFFTPFAFVKQASTGYVTENLLMNLMAYDPSSYPGTGTTITDLSGNGLNGTISGSVNFSSSGYLNFDGSTNYISVLDNSLLDNLGTAYTFDNYVYINNYTERWRLMNKWVNTAGGQGYTFSTQTTSGKLFNYTNAALAGNALSPTAVGLNAWKQVVLVRSGTSIKMYVNGAEVWSTTTETTDAPFATSQNLFMGYGPMDLEFGEGRWAHGRIYTAALSAAQVLQNYNALPTL